MSKQTTAPEPGHNGRSKRNETQWLSRFYRSYGGQMALGKGQSRKFLVRTIKRLKASDRLEAAFVLETMLLQELAAVSETDEVYALAKTMLTNIGLAEPWDVLGIAQLFSKSYADYATALAWIEGGLAHCEPFGPCTIDMLLIKHSLMIRLGLPQKVCNEPFYEANRIIFSRSLSSYAFFECLGSLKACRRKMPPTYGFVGRAVWAQLKASMEFDGRDYSADLAKCEAAIKAAEAGFEQ